MFEAGEMLVNCLGALSLLASQRRTSKRQDQKAADSTGARIGMSTERIELCISVK